MKAKAILFTGVDQVVVDEAHIPDPGPGEVLVEAVYTCISPGTEMRCLAGKQERSPESWPFIPGYCMAARVIAAGPETSLQVGTPIVCGGTTKSDRNHMWGAHVSHAVLPEQGAYLLPENVDLLEVSAAKLAAIAYHGLRLSRPQPHETVAVVGLGPIGQFSARLHALTGARVVGGDLSAERVELTQKAGVEAILVPPGELVQAFREALPDGADVVVDATGVPPVLPQAIEIARDKPWDDSLTPGARFVVQGSYADGFTVPYQHAFLKELSFLMPRDTPPRDIRAVLDLMARGKLQTRDVIGQVHTPEEAPAVYAALQAGSGGVLTMAFKWS